MIIILNVLLKAIREVEIRIWNCIEQMIMNIIIIECGNGSSRTCDESAGPLVSRRWYLESYWFCVFGIVIEVVMIIVVELGIHIYFRKILIQSENNQNENNLYII